MAPALYTSGRDPSLTELAAGSGLLAPIVRPGCRAHPEPAAAVPLPVVRRPSTGRVTVLGRLLSASGARTRPTAHGRIPARAPVRGTEGCRRVRLRAGAATDELAIGDRVWFRHREGGRTGGTFELGVGYWRATIGVTV